MKQEWAGRFLFGKMRFIQCRLSLGRVQKRLIKDGCDASCFFSILRFEIIKMNF